MPGEEVRYILKGETLEELAARIEERLAELKEHTGGVMLAPEFVPNLEASIERYNGFARTGVDDDFGRGSSAIAAYWSGEPRPGARNTMHEFRDRGPYYSMLLVAGALDTKGGPKTNAKSQVLNTHGEPIPGLYGAGNCVASPAGQAYWGPGGTIGPAITFGWIAGLHAAKEPEKVL
jgi:succinate dehydrogenase/fumarate reductase flavoprotein subunit